MPRVIAGAVPEEHGAWWQRESSSSGVVNSAPERRRLARAARLCAPSLFRLCVMCLYLHTANRRCEIYYRECRPASDAVRVRLEINTNWRERHGLLGLLHKLLLRTDMMKVSE
jgi:hypothetical protein